MQQQHSDLRCPDLQYNVTEQLGMKESPIELVVVNTNYNTTFHTGHGLLPCFCCKHAAVPEDYHLLNFKEEKQYIREAFSCSPPSRWRVVAGHHPVEYIPFNVVEHSCPFKTITTTFMRNGRWPGRCINPHDTMRNVFEDTGVDAYYCGHQHLMACFAPTMKIQDGVRSVKSPASAVDAYPGQAHAGCPQFHILGSGSKIEQDDEDYASCFPWFHQKNPNNLGNVQVSCFSRVFARLCCRLGRERDRVARRCQRHWYEMELGFAWVSVTFTELQTMYFRVVQTTDGTVALPVAVHTQRKQAGASSSSSHVEVTLHRRLPLWDDKEEVYTKDWESCNVVPCEHNLGHHQEEAQWELCSPPSAVVGFL